MHGQFRRSGASKRARFAIVNMRRAGLLPPAPNALLLPFLGYIYLPSTSRFTSHSLHKLYHHISIPRKTSWISSSSLQLTSSFTVVADALSSLRVRLSARSKTIMRADLDNTAMSWDGGNTKRVLFDLTNYDENSAGALLDDYATFSSSPVNTSSDESFNVDYEMLDIQNDVANNQGTEAGQQTVADSFATPQTNAKAQAQPAQATPPKAHHSILEDTALNYITIYPKTPNCSQVPIILIHGDFHTPKASPWRIISYRPRPADTLPDLD